MQAGWTIDYDRYMPANGDLLPARLVLTPCGGAGAHRGGSLGGTCDERGEREAAPWPAPAKLNLFLHIVGRRPDGYHELQTCFQFVDLCDDIRIEVRADGEIRRGRALPGVPADADLCVRAARALKGASGCALGADIEVVKRIPMGAGLGGGSSDAATCLRGAQSAVGAATCRAQELAQLGLKLGADVPVFVHGRVAWAEGVGERLTPLYPPDGSA